MSGILMGQLFLSVVLATAFGPVSKSEVSAAVPIGEVRECWFFISWFDGAPAGFQRRLLGVNSQFPGPTIRANYGDLLRVHVTNNIQTRENTSIHWHGLHQRGTPWEDGPEQVSQCPIQFGMTYTYEFQLLEPGTHWYHSHHGEQWADGLWGALIVDRQPEVYGHLYEDELTITITDHFLATGQAIKDWYLSPVNPGLDAPVPYATLINGQGTYPCSYAELQGIPCVQKPRAPTVIEVQAGLAYRVRVIDASSARVHWFSIDSHRMEAIEVDGVDTRLGGPVDTVFMSTAQRFSFIVNMTTGVAGDEFYVRARVNFGEAFPNPEFDINPYPEALVDPGLAILRYVDKPGQSKSVRAPIQVEPLSQATPTPLEPVRLGPQHILPYGHRLAPDHFDEELVVTFDEDRTTDGHPYFTTNEVLYQPGAHGGTPNLFQAFWNQTPPDSSIPLFTETGEGHVIQVVINNRHKRGHPFHLHGHHFWVVGQGENGSGEYYNETEHESFLRTDVPLRDTERFPGASWLVIRYIADNPGVWLLHCHVNWHIAGGMATVIFEGQEAMRDSLQLPGKSLKVCTASGVIPP